jgi:hypothetical protein
MIPVLDLTMSDRVMNAISRSVGSGERLISDEEVQIFCATLSCQMATTTASSSSS